MSDDVVFTVDQVAACSTALRTALGKPPEHLSIAQFIGMISDEIEQLRAEAWSDVEIAALISETTGSVVGAGDVATFYAGPEARRPG